MNTKTTSPTTSAASAPSTTAAKPGAAIAETKLPWPPPGLAKVATGNVPFFRGATGDRLYGTIVGDNDALSTPDPLSGVMRHVKYVEVQYACPTVAKVDGKTVEGMAKPGDLINVGVKANTAPLLMKPNGTKVAFEVGEKIGIGGGKSMYLIDGYSNAAENERLHQQIPSGTEPQLGN